jgi:hypothetical protein
VDLPHCALHAEREALVTCARCGSYLCAVCMSSWEGKIVCISCVRRSSDRGASRRAVGSAVVSGLSLMLTLLGAAVVRPLALLSLPLSFLGLGFALGELNAIRAGISSRGGQVYARLGVGLGAVAMVGAAVSLVLR